MTNAQKLAAIGGGQHGLVDIGVAQHDQRAAVAPLDPTSAYPKPPFPKQQQPWPGLASKMSPRPDHGETSYKGSGRLKGRKALLTGGDDYELCFTAPADRRDAVQAAGRDTATRVTRIGCIEAPPGLRLIGPDGAAMAPRWTSFDHFAAA